MKTYFLFQVQLNDAIKETETEMVDLFFSPFFIVCFLLLIGLFLFIVLRSNFLNIESNNEIRIERKKNDNSLSGLIVKPKTNYSLAWLLIIGVGVYIGGHMLYYRLGYSPTKHKTTFTCPEGKKIISYNWYTNLKGDFVLNDKGITITKEDPCHSGVITHSPNDKLVLN